MLTANPIKSVVTEFPTTTHAFVHIVTLINRRTGQEAGLEITTLSDRFADVMREIAHQKAMHGLIGFEVYETLDCNLNMKAEFVARMGHEIVAHIDPMPMGYLMVFNDGRRIPAASLQEYRDAGYVVEAKR